MLPPFLVVFIVDVAVVVVVADCCYFQPFPVCVGVCFTCVRFLWVCVCVLVCLHVFFFFFTFVAFTI